MGHYEAWAEFLLGHIQNCDMLKFLPKNLDLNGPL